jgi:hypothetical protein
MFFIGNEIVLSEKSNVAKADIIYLFFKFLSTLGPLKFVISRVLFEASVEKCTGKPTTSRGKIADSSKTDLCVQVVNEIEMKLTL